MWKAVALVLLVPVVLVSIVALMWFNAVREEKTLRNQVTAQQDVNVASFDTMWKILVDKSGVTQEYKKTFETVYPKLIAARNPKERTNLLANFVTESNPDFDTILLKDLMASIEGERKNFLREQKKLRDMKTRHDNLIDVPPSSWFLAGIDKIDVVLVTSDKAEEAFETGRDNDSLFKKE